MVSCISVLPVSQVAATNRYGMIYAGGKEQGMASSSASTHNDATGPNTASVEPQPNSTTVDPFINGLLSWLDLEMGATRTDNPLHQPAEGKGIFDHIMQHLTYTKMFHEWTDMCSCGENRTGVAVVGVCVCVRVCRCVCVPIGESVVHEFEFTIHDGC